MLKTKLLKVRIVQNKICDIVLNMLSIGKNVKMDAFTTLPNLIIVRKNKLKIELIAHELVHVDQWRRTGLLKFIWKYLRYNIKFGYWLNPYEIEAYKLQNSNYYIDKSAKLLAGI